MHTQPQEKTDFSFLIGMMAGGVIGAGLAMLFAPRTGSELRQRVTDSATELGDAASRHYEDAATRVTDVMDSVTERGQAVRDSVADAVGRGAREVEQFAMAAKAKRPK